MVKSQKGFTFFEFPNHCPEHFPPKEIWQLFLEIGAKMKNFPIFSQLSFCYFFIITKQIEYLFLSIYYCIRNLINNTEIILFETKSASVPELRPLTIIAPPSSPPSLVLSEPSPLPIFKVYKWPSSPHTEIPNHKTIFKIVTWYVQKK